MTAEETLYLVALSRLKGITGAMAQQLIDKAGSAENLFRLKEAELRRLTGLGKAVFSGEVRNAALEVARREMDFIGESRIRVLFFADEDYPFRLRECADAPALLYYKGAGSLNQMKVVSVVGTRHATPYGKSFCETFIRELSVIFPDVLIVSGLAYGIDICAHRTALRNGLRTVGVLAHGLNMLYPEIHRQTAGEMIRQGGLLTEYTSGNVLHRGNFIARNRIVAGMSDATVVIESAEKGGALITADLAGGYGRDVFAVPGRIQDAFSRGCNRLISGHKAALVSSAAEFVDAMCWERPQPEAVREPVLFPELNMEEELILKILGEEGDMQINGLMVRSGLPASRIMSLLFELEFKGLVRAFPGGVYRLS